MFLAYRSLSLRCAMFGSMFMVISMSVSSAEWTLTNAVSTSAVYTDNANLTSSAKESELSGLVTPSFSLQGKGRRADVDITGALEINSQDNATESLNPRLQADANAEIFERVVFIDLNATATQNAIEPTLAVGDTNLGNRGNTTTTYSYKISPYIKSRFKGLADLELRYTYNEVNHSEDNVSDTQSDTFNLSIDSGTDFSTGTWGIDARHRTTNNDQREISKLSSLDLRLGYQINRRWQVNGSIGTESNDFTSIRTSQDGSKWDIGARWTPSSRTDLEFGLGKRFFGNTRRLSLSHTSKRSVLTATYSHDLTDSSTQLSDQEIFARRDAFNDTVINPVTGYPFAASDNLSTINDSLFVDERFEITYTLKGRRTTLTLNGEVSEQTYQDSSRELSRTGLGASLSRTLSGKLTADVSLNWNQLEESGTGNSESDTWRLQTGLNQRLGQKTNLRLNYSHTDRSSNQTGQSYDENRLSLTLNHTL